MGGFGNGLVSDFPAVVSCMFSTKTVFMREKRVKIVNFQQAKAVSSGLVIGAVVSCNSVVVW